MIKIPYRTAAAFAALTLVLTCFAQTSFANNSEKGRLIAAGDKPEFKDIADFNGEKEIKDLVKLDVLNAGSGKFEPAKGCKRSAFVAWVVRANNVLRPDEKIRLADPGSKATFSDVPSTHPQFKFIQGMANAGWSVGYDDKTFKPDNILTREEMIAIKTPLDAGKDLKDENRPSIQQWSDYKKIGKRYIGPMSWETAWTPNWDRCFGKTKSCEPQKPVTRAEAALCVWQFGFSDGKKNPGNYK